MAFTIYGQFAAGTVPRSLILDRSNGARLSSDSQGRPDWIDLQFESAEHGLVELRLPFLEALALLSFLNSLQLDSGVPFPDDPRADRPDVAPARDGAMNWRWLLALFGFIALIAAGAFYWHRSAQQQERQRSIAGCMRQSPNMSESQCATIVDAVDYTLRRKDR